MEPAGRGGTGGYGEAVPSVARALAVLERLRGRREGLALSQLSRDLGISPSSLLAILRTLAARGYVERVDPPGLYRAGPALTRLGEDHAAAVAVHDVTGSVAKLAEVALAALPAGAPGGRDEALQALGLAAQRLAALLLAESGAPAAPPAESDALWREDAAGPLGPAELDRFLGGAWLATLSCVKPNGYPYSVPIWYQWEAGRFWVAPRARAEWADYLAANPRVSLAIGEPEPPLRRVLVEGHAEAAAGSSRQAGAAGVVARMAERYLGAAAPRYLAATACGTRRLFAIVPEKLVTWRGLAPHPRYAAEPPRGDDGEVA